jgi:hypothetical protein
MLATTCGNKRMRWVLYRREVGHDGAWVSVIQVLMGMIF